MLRSSAQENSLHEVESKVNSCWIQSPPTVSAAPHLVMSQARSGYIKAVKVGASIVLVIETGLG